MADDIVRKTGPEMGPAKDPTSPYYIYHPEHPRLADTVPSSITTPRISPQLPYAVAFLTGFHNRTQFMKMAMAARGEPALGRPLTPVEAAVLTRYTQVIRNGGEWAGILGMVTATAMGMRTDLWPMEGMIRSSLGMQPRESGWSPAPSETATPPPPPPSTTSSSSATSSSSSSSTTASSSGAAAAEASSSSEAAAAEASASQKPKWSFQTWTMSTIAEDPRLGSEAFKRILDKKAQLYQKLASYPPEHRGERGYRMSWTAFKINLSMERDLMRAQLVAQEKLVAQAKEALKEGEALAAAAGSEKEFPSDKGKSLMKQVKKLEVIRDETKMLIEEASAALAAMESRAEIKAPEVINPAEAKPSEASPFSRSQPRIPQPPPKGSPFVEWSVGAGESPWSRRAGGGFIRILTWAWLGKYIGSTLGLMFFVSRSRRLEAQDERLQEYNYDRMEYARYRAQQLERSMPKPASQPVPIERPKTPEGGARARAKEDTRFQEADTQSLGGLQDEAIDWGDFKLDESPATAPAQRVPLPRPGESSWDRARREQDGPQQPAMHEDSWAPREQQDRAVSNDSSSSSTWDRIREQASEAYGGGKRIPGESRVNETPTGESAWSRVGQQGKSESPKSREELQREFDSELEKEWRGGK
ncbi:hypothetical protein AA313_de0205360 [Arthrobotrys entomopaga]|nr:hypothetical protein AA313_de0205360 [Arthrobotrys entomopaga]